jgi:hypothetical protein
VSLAFCRVLFACGLGRAAEDTVDGGRGEAGVLEQALGFLDERGESDSAGALAGGGERSGISPERVDG